MRRKSVLNRQSVKRRNSRGLSIFWRGIRLFTSLSFKISVLVIGMIALSLLFLYLYEYLVSSPYIRLEQVIITGVDEDTKRDLINLSEMNADSSLLSININEIKEKMERHPWVRSVALEKRFPHTLIVKAEKEIPVALVVLDRLSYMNSSGTVFKEVGQEDDKDYPIITGISEVETIRDEQLKIAALVLDIFGAETGAWSHKEISEIHVSEDGDVSLYSISMPAVIRMGSVELSAKKDELKKIIEHLKETGRIHTVKTIDMNYQDGAVVSFNKAG